MPVVVETILAIETSVPSASLSLWCDGDLVFDESFTSERGHNTSIFSPLEQALKLAGDTLGQIVVGTGPGSYSGTRIGIATAQGVAISRSCPVAGLGSIAATQEAREGCRFALGDARRGLFYAVEMSESGLASEPELMDAVVMEKRVESSNTSPWLTLDPVEKMHGLLGFPPEVSVVEVMPSSKNLIDVWLGLDEETRRSLNQKPLTPTYLRPPFTSKAKPGHPLLRS